MNLSPANTTSAADTHVVVNDYLAGCDELSSAFEGMNNAMMTARPIPEKWTAQELLCHIVDTDQLVAFRIRAALATDAPRINAFTHDEMTTILAANARDAAEEIELFRAVRSQTARIVRSMPVSVFDRTVILVKGNGEEVVRTVREFLTGITKHARHHLSFIAEKRRALGLSPS